MLYRSVRIVRIVDDGDDGDGDYEKMMMVMMKIRC